MHRLRNKTEEETSENRMIRGFHKTAKNKISKNASNAKIGTTIRFALRRAMSTSVVNECMRSAPMTFTFGITTRWQVTLLLSKSAAAANAAALI